jgi:hypothetical protein
MQETNALRREAEQLMGDRNAFDGQIAGIEREAAARAKLNQQIRQDNLLRDVTFEREQIGRGEDERERYGRLRSAGTLVNGQIADSAAAALDGQMRLNQQLERTKQLANDRASVFRDEIGNSIASAQREAGVTPESAYGGWISETMRMTDSLEKLKSSGADVFKGFASDLRAGVKPAEAFTNALTKIGDKMFDASVDQLYNSAWGALGNATGLDKTAAAPLSTASMAVTATNVTVTGGIGSAVAAAPLAAIPGTTVDGQYIPKNLGLTSGAVNDNVAGAGGSGWLSYANQGSTRNRPLNPNLTQDFSFLKDMGVQMKVLSGGQSDVHSAATKGKPGGWTGSTRHDNGNAADVMFYKDGRQLDWRNPQDIPTYQGIVSQARANGVTGFGAGPGYMSPGSMHVGYGDPGVWGAGGDGANAPSWLREAYSSPARGMETAPLTDAFKDLAANTNDLSKSVLAPTAPLATSAAELATSGAQIGQSATSFAGGFGGALQSIFGIVGGLAPSIISGFDKGGYTGPGGVTEAAGVVHRGEVVFSQQDVSRAGGVRATERLRRSGGMLPAVAVPTPARPSAAPISYRGGDIIIQGNADQNTAADIDRRLAANNKAMLQEFKRMSANTWRD